jgi:hypothetical protein
MAGTCVTSWVIRASWRAEPHTEVPAVDDRTLTFVGLDVSQRSISVAVLPPSGSPLREDRIANTPEAVRQLAGAGPRPGLL